MCNIECAQCTEQTQCSAVDCEEITMRQCVAMYDRTRGSGWLVQHSRKRTKKQAGGNNASVGVTASTFAGETRMAWILGGKMTSSFFQGYIMYK